MLESICCSTLTLLQSTYLFIDKPRVSVKVAGSELGAVEKQQEFTLSCNIDSNPPQDSIEWRKNGQTIPGAQLNQLVDERINDDTEYECIVTNKVGESSGQLNVLVHCKSPLFISLLSVSCCVITYEGDDNLFIILTSLRQRIWCLHLHKP